MGQKTNSNILRLNIKKNQWNSKYFEKNKEEFTVYNYQNVQIQTYLKEMFNQVGIILHDCKIQLNENYLYIYISYYVTKRAQNTINKASNFNNLKTRQKKLNKSTKVLKSWKQIKNLKLSDFSNHQSLKTVKKTQFKIKRLQLLNKYKQYLLTKKKFTLNQLNKQTFLQKLLENLNIYTNNKYNISLTTQNINKGMTIKLNNHELTFLKKKIFLFRRYLNRSFFKESFNILITASKMKNSAKLIAEYISLEIAQLKRHNFFLIFLKQILNFLIKTKVFKIEGIKIAIKGRFNNAPRAKTKIILIGNIPIQTLKKPINYHESVSYTKNGTFGIKVWIN